MRCTIRTLAALLALGWGGAFNVTYAAELTAAEVTAAVTTWVHQVTTDPRPDATVVAMLPHKAVGRTAAYVVTLSTGGYAICGADDRLLPVYLYAPAETFDPLNPLSRDLLANIGRRLTAFEQAAATRDPVLDEYATGLAQRTAMWDGLLAGKVPPSSLTRTTPTTLALPVTDYWHQGSPYNHFCPELILGSDQHSVVGCVATALSEIMHYWHWPSTATGSVSATYHVRYSNTWIDTPLANDPNIPAGWAGGTRLRYMAASHTLQMNDYWDNSIYYDGAINLSDDPDYLDALALLWDMMTVDDRALSANLGAATFDWSQIGDAHTAPYGTEDEQVAGLCYCAGLSVEMGYGLWSSNSNINQAANAYSDHFYYDPAATVTSCNESTIITEVQWLRPVQMRGSSDAGGHSFVVCGYNDTVSPRQFLINQGWGGGSTAWLSLDSFFPDDQYHVIHIAPLSVVRFVGGLYGGTGTPDHPYVTLATALADAPDGTTLIMKAASTHTLPTYAATLSRPMTLKGAQVTIERE